jgi:two-component system, chemotaxis family, CheB/CheR fusion protein
MDPEPSADNHGKKPTDQQGSPSSSPSALFPIVGIGASAGGLEAFIELLSHLPMDSGMAFVLIQHLAPQHESMLTEVLSRATRLPVAEITEGVVPQADHVYIIPPNTNMAIARGTLHLIPRTPQRGQQMPIDHFLASMAEDRKDKAIGVILSGTASDGTLGLKAIKAEGGFTFAQDETAKYDSMPKSAIAAGYVDYILSPQEIAKELARIVRHPYVAPTKAAAKAGPLPEEDLGKIFLWLRSATGVDFSHYKKATIIRRIKRRMVLRNIESLADYEAGLQGNRAELDALYRDMLINVTSFFREPETFEALQSEVFPQLLVDRSPEAPLRVWVPACSTGEEAYSIAMCALEFLRERESAVGLQLFATDISDPALEKARAGKYTEGEVSEVGPERLEKFFTRTEGGYQVKKPVRDLCVFAKQNIINDPPFSRLDLISCRNLLIYLDGSLQKKLMPIFHYALRSQGFLVLGRSEGANEFADLFKLIDRKGRIFAKKPKPIEGPAYSTLNEWASMNTRTVALPVPASRDFDLQKEVTRTLLTDYTPPGVVVNSDLEIVQFHGHTGPYLDPGAGVASLRLLKMAREGLPLELHTAIHQAQEGNKTILKEGIRVSSGGETREVSIEVRPLKADSLNRRHFLILFREAPAPKSPRGDTAGEKEAGRASELLALTQQLDQNKSELEDMIEQFATHNEELQTANEEIQSNNEELQSTNEELETAKEELQATNEELTTMNDELRNRNLDLSVSNNDLNNVIANINIPILILGSDLRIRRMNPSAEAVLNLIPADVGRPITDLRSALDFPGLEALVSEAIQTSAVKEREVQDPQGHWHSLRVRPYKTSDNRIEGAVITLVDISAVKAEAIGARSYAEAIVETVRESVLVLDADLRVKAANRAFYDTFWSSPENTLDRPLQELGKGQWNIPTLLGMLREMLPKHKEVREFKVEHEFPGIGRRAMLFNAFQMKHSGNEPRLTLLAITDFTDRQRSMEILQEQSRMIDLAHDAIIVRSPNGVIRLWNKGAATLYGWTREEALGKITHLLLKTKFPEPLEEVERKLMNQGEWSGELVHTSRSGNQIIVTSRQVLQRRHHDQPDAILEINRDVTQHMQAEASLRSSEARLRALVSSIDDIIFEVDPQGRCLSAWTGNPKLLAQSRDKQRAQSIEDFLPAQSVPPLREAIDRVIKGNTPESVEYALDLGGGKRWFIARINRIVSQENAPKTLSVLVREITPRKEAEIALQQSEERFRLLVEGVKDYAIFALDTEGRVASWNRGAERIKGYRRDEIIGKHFSVFYPPEDIAAGKPDKDLRVAAAEGRWEDVGSWRVRKDGTRFFANLLISAIHDKDGTLRGFTKITRDITDRMRAEDAVRQLSGHILRLQDEERRRIARDLHDSTAQLLTALSMNLSLAGRRPSVAHDEQASQLIKEGEALAMQASDEIRSTSHLLHPPDLDAVGLVAAIRWYAARFSERSGISVNLNLPDDMCRMPQDNEIALFRVMQESLTNVQRHSGSKVARIRIRQHDDVVDLQIEDRGHGIPEGVLGQEHQSVERLGVGIAGMRERLKQLGGRLEIVSSPRGTKVKATVPCPPDQPSKKATTGPET